MSFIVLVDISFLLLHLNGYMTRVSVEFYITAFAVRGLMFLVLALR